MSIYWKDFIESSPEVLRGKPRLKGTRIPVSMILGYLAEGMSEEEIIRDFPDLSSDQIKACLGYAKELSEIESAG